MDSTALSREYHALSDEEFAKYRDAGKAATAAHQMGLQPFAREPGHGLLRLPASMAAAAALADAPQPGTMTATGAIVDTDQDDRMRLEPFTGP